MTSKQPGLLQPLPIPAAPWTELSMDFIIGLPNSAGYTTVLVVVDRLTKVAHFSPLKPNFTAKSVAEVFMNSVIKLHGFPLGIVSDRDPIFLSNFWKQLMLHGGTKLHHSSAYHPQSDGQTEVVNRCLEQYLRAFASHQPSVWQKYLSLAELCYNTTHHSSIGMSPHQALYGYNPKLLPTYIPGSASAEEIDITLVNRQQLQQQLQHQISQAQSRMKKYVDSKRRDAEFEPGQWVWAKFHHYKQQSAAKRLNFKLANRYFGPFLISARIGKVAYRLDLPSDCKIHPVLHVSLLKPYKGPLPPPSVVYEESQLPPLPLPHAIMAERWTETLEGRTYQVLVEWTNQTREHATWEDWDTLVDLYTVSALEDKVLFQRGGNDMTQDHHTRNQRVKGAPSWATDFVSQI